MKNSAIITILVALVVGGAAFFGGIQYQKMQTNSRTGQGASFQGRGRTGGQAGMRPVSGQIISQDSSSITVKMSDGSSKIVLISGSTQINKTSTAGVSDLQSGQTVAVFGTQNSDGSVTASNIQLNPLMRGGVASPTASPKQSI